jgi:geranylgeranyl diphosphate synthase type II
VATPVKNSPFERYLARTRRRVDAALDARLPRRSKLPSRLHESIRYSVFAGGKRLRPALCLLACESVCGRSAPALPAAAALEMIHTFSLIHDDLPGMDDDDWRRGRPANHKVFGEGMAILGRFWPSRSRRWRSAVGEIARAADAPAHVTE